MASGIFWVSSQKIPALLARIIEFSDKLFHAAAFATLAIAVAFAVRIAHRTSPRQTAVLAGLFASLYGASDEWHQLYVPGRSADLLDIAADSVGATIAAAVAGWILVHRGRGPNRDSRRS